jgi:tetratricopeptide (TPR) repeat protein
VELLDWTNKEKVTKSQGVLKETKKKGDGWETPADGSVCTVKYKGMLPNGKVFTESKGETKITLPDASIIEGLEEAIKSMKRGEQSKFFIQPHYAYGEKGNTELGVPANSKLVFDVDLVSFEKGRQTWDMNDKEKLDHANKLKDMGNTMFKAGNGRRARKKYDQALKVFHAGKEKDLSDELQKSLRQLKTSCEANIALIRLKEKNYASVVKHANNALEQDAGNVKAYVRRGQAHMAKGDHEEAMRDFKKAVELDPKSQTEVSSLMATVNKKLEEHRKKERAAFAGMFSKVNLSDAKPKAAEAPKQEAAKTEPAKMDTA